MTLAEYLGTSVEKRNALARKLGCSADYLWQITVKWRGRQASHELAKRVEIETGGAVSRQEMRPDVFGPSPDQRAAA